MKNSNYEIDILVNGKPQKIHYYQGKYYIEGRENYEYSIKIKNNSYNKILAVVSVDSLSVMDGEKASNSSGGYIIEPWQNYEIKGYRKDLNSVGTFKFTHKNRSYAQSQHNGTEINCGVIGVRIFEELKKPEPIVIKEKEFVPYPVYPKRPYKPYWPYDYPFDTTKPYFGDPPWTITCDNSGTTWNSSLSNSSDSSHQMRCYNMSVNSDIENSIGEKKAKFSLGSTWGQKVQDSVVESTFERGNLVFSQDIYYSTRQDLIDMGVPILKQPKISYPQSFPSKFAKPPKGWE